MLSEEYVRRYREVVRISLERDLQEEQEREWERERQWLENSVFAPPPPLSTGVTIHRAILQALDFVLEEVPGRPTSIDDAQAR